MRVQPLGLAAAGVAAVGLDLRVVAWDLLPDVIGWSLIAYAAWRLGIRWTSGLAVVAAVASVVEAQIAYHYDAIDPITGAIVPHPGPDTAYHELLAFDMLSGARLALLGVAVASGGAALWILLRELARRVAAHADERSARWLGLLAWAVALGWAAPQLLRIAGQVLLGDSGYDPVWNGAWEIPAMAGIAAMVAVALLFATTANREWSASGGGVSSPWAELRRRGKKVERWSSNGRAY